MNRLARLCGLVALSGVVMGATDEGERLSIKVSPAVAMAPADLFVRATIASSDENRVLQIVAESDDFYRSSEVPLEGGRAPRITQFRFRNLPGGIYSVRVVLKGSQDETRAQARQQVNVVEGHYDR